MRSRLSIRRRGQTVYVAEGAARRYGRQVDRVRALEMIDTVDVAVLATIRPDGRPRPVPIVFAVLPDDRVVSAVDHKPKSTRRLRRLDDIAGDPRVSLLFQHFEDDWSGLWWVRIDGRAEVVDLVADDVQRRLVERYEQYRDRPPAGPWIVITPENVLGWP